MRSPPPVIGYDCRKEKAHKTYWTKVSGHYFAGVYSDLAGKIFHFHKGRRTINLSPHYRDTLLFKRPMYYAVRLIALHRNG